jgi:signal transduction histidine kinase
LSDPGGAAAFQAAPCALLAVDGQDVVRLANVEATRLLRGNAGELAGRQLVDVLPDDRGLDVVANPVPDVPGWTVLALVEREHDALLGDLIRAQERERARIAVAVHDDSLQVITAAMLRLQQLRQRLVDPDALDMLRRLEESVALAADRLRRLIVDFRPPVLDQAGLAAAVRDLLSRLRDDAGVEVRLDDRLAGEPPAPARLLLYRVAQEALVNVAKHAKASRVEVTLAEQDAGYLLRVADDGVGVGTGRPQALPGHLGLTLMRERAELTGGWFRFESAATGTTVSVWIPRGARH